MIPLKQQIGRKKKKEMPYKSTSAKRRISMPMQPKLDAPRRPTLTMERGEAEGQELPNAMTAQSPRANAVLRDMAVDRAR